MKKINGFKFPETCEEAARWQSDMFYASLDRNVIAIARSRVEGTWKAYITNCPGEDHDKEMRLLWPNATQLREQVARAIFPALKDIPYAK